MKTINDFEPLFPAEQKLLHACKNGEIAIMSKNRPSRKTKDNEIRAEFLRTLILTEKDSINQKGIHFIGAYVSGSFDFRGCETNLSFLFFSSFFKEEIVLQDSNIRHLNLHGSSVPNIEAERMKCKDSVFLRDGFTVKGDINFTSMQINGDVELSNGLIAMGEVDFSSAKIGGDLTCSGGRFENEDGYALICQGAKIDGGVWLNESFAAIGEVNFVSAKIGGNLTCSGGKFENEGGKALICDKAKISGGVFLGNGFEAKGEVNFNSATISNSLTCSGGTFENEDGYALICQEAKINSSIWLDESFNAKGEVSFAALRISGSLICANAQIDGVFNLDSAKVKDLRDSENFWNHEGLRSVSLDGFVYGHIHNDFQAEKRKKWLSKMPEFRPQPYKQLAKVLQDMGHIDDAAEIMIEYHDRRSREFKSRLKKLFFGVYKLFSDYGYSPSKVVKWMASIWLFCGIIYWVAAMNGIFAPSNPIIIQEGNYTEKCRENWYLCKELPPEYTTFQPFWYSLDVILPVVDLQMEKDWGVKIDTPVGWSDVMFANTTANSVTRWIIWIENLMGWVLSLILVAILSGLVKNEKD